jgi:hypothetical protein
MMLNGMISNVKAIPDCMRNYLSVVVVGMLLSASAFAGEVATEDAVLAAVKKLQSRDLTGLVTADYRKPMTGALTFLENLSMLHEEDSRVRLLRFSCQLFRIAKARGPQVEVADRQRMMRLLARIVQDDESSRVRDQAALVIEDSFAANELEPFRDLFRRAAVHWNQESLVLLYGLLPSVGYEEWHELARKSEGTAGVHILLFDGIKARKGDDRSRERLQSILEQTAQSSYARLEVMVRALFYADSLKMKVFLGERLRSEVVIDLPGGAALPLRNCCARSLVKMLRWEPAFPIREEKWTFSDEELGQLESWCATHLGVRYPTSLRKPLRILPSIEPTR